MNEPRDTPSAKRKPWQIEGEELLPQSVQTAIELQMLRLSEIPDRNSPEDFPEGYVLTRAEIVGAFLSIIGAALAAARSSTGAITPEMTQAGIDYWKSMQKGEPVLIPVGEINGIYTAMRAAAPALPSTLATPDAQERYEAMVKATKSHVDGRDLLYELNPNGAHFINIKVRINGQWKEYEGDWLKRLMWARDGNKRGGRPEMTEAERQTLTERLDSQTGAGGNEASARSAIATTGEKT